MSDKHTQEPWQVAEESFDNDGIHESVIRGLDGRAAIAVTLEFGPNNPAMREANARRIVACVNACAGVSTEILEDSDASITFPDLPYRKLKQQRDELQTRMEIATETHLISDTYAKIRSERIFAADDLEYDLFAAGWKAAIASLKGGA